ncbi:MAG: hypothetical protein RIT27_2305 [Pseudomonadota bacterium]
MLSNFDDVIINKIQSIQRCILRATEEHQLAGISFIQDFSRQDAAVLNITRACEQTIDLANYLIKKNKLGIPNSSRESFELLAQHNMISISLCQQLQKMVGFRNIAIHEYQKLNPHIIVSIIETGLEDLLAFTFEIKKGLVFK